MHRTACGAQLKTVARLVWEKGLLAAVEGDMVCLPPGRQRFSQPDRKLLADRGLNICGLSRKLVHEDDMLCSSRSIEGKKRGQMFHNARIRAHNRGVKFDLETMKAILH
ncbi:unnamed protein product [Polarella glacialis]|uniref:Uncharacterized protein n=1 Tax=Polarella glacialis TaxID=89957 RepID=A0A813KLQ3_POLGL|nr:unnamed protein product [Polarella glacialis]